LTSEYSTFKRFRTKACFPVRLLRTHTLPKTSTTLKPVVDLLFHKQVNYKKLFENHPTTALGDFLCPGEGKNKKKGKTS